MMNDTNEMPPLLLHLLLLLLLMGSVRRLAAALQRLATTRPQRRSCPPFQAGQLRGEPARQKKTHSDSQNVKAVPLESVALSGLVWWATSQAQIRPSPRRAFMASA